MKPVRPVLGVLIPCRNEERVLARKLSNLELARWPEADAPHRIVVVDDGSTDETAARARELCESLFEERSDLHAELVQNRVRAGKSGAIEAGLAALAGVDLIVLSDADVIVHPGALVALAAAFEEPSTGMVSGSQRFVRELADDGSARGPGGAPLYAADDLFDRATAGVRALESRTGRLFSVHGQLLAWRASLGIAPTAGIAADDIDLALAVRAAGAHVRLAPQALFFETKTERGPAGEEQALRRARAYIQVVQKPGASLGRGALDRLQFAFYRFVPLLAPELLLLLIAALVVLTYTSFGAGAVAGLLAALLLALATPQGRQLARLVSIIRRARSTERAQALSDSWEMERS